MAPFGRDKILLEPPLKLDNTTDGEHTKAVMKVQTISFLTLPGELRNRIYEEVIEGLGIHTKVATKILPSCRLHGKGIRGGMIRAIVSSCRLGQVSRTVRKEFLSMLWRRFLFYYSDCKSSGCLEAPEIGDLQYIAPILRGNVTSLVFLIHSDQDVPTRFSVLANILLAVEFKGALLINGHKGRVDAVEEGLELIRLTGAYERDTMAAVKSIEKQIDRRKWKGSERSTRVFTFDITNSQNTRS